MDAPILKTKLTIPLLRPRRVMRQELIARLTAGLWDSGQFTRVLTYISAPAGYGKTTLVAAWLSTLPSSDADVKTAWLSLDAEDNDPTIFLNYLVAAMQTVQTGFGNTVLAMLQSPQPPPETTLLTTLLNEITELPTPTILVLDDYHELQTLAIHQQVAYLLEHLPTTIHLVLVTRTDPLLPLARIRAGGQMLEVRSDQLRFSSQECIEFMGDVMGIPLSTQYVAALERRTEGWIAGLQLAALSLQTHPNPGKFIADFTGSSHFILDYLIEEVFQQQPDDIQDFWLRTAILERLCGPLCDALTQRTNSQEILESLEQANLFILPLDQSRQWYRYHRLFSELLRHRLRRAPDINQSDLHDRASQWFSQQGLLPEAIQYAITGGNWHQARELILKVSTDMLKRGETATLLRWYGAFPPEMFSTDPMLCFQYCWPLMIAGQFDTAAPLLAQLEQITADMPTFLGEVLAAKAYLARARGDQTRMMEYSRRALGYLPKTSLDSRGLVSLNLGLGYWHTGQMLEAETILAEALETNQVTGNLYAILTVLIFQGRIHAVRGQLYQAASYARRAIEQGGKIPINTLAHLDMAALHYEWNNLLESQQQLRKAIELSQVGQNDEFTVGCWLMMVRLCMALGDFTGAEQCLATIQTRIDQGGIPPAMCQRAAAIQAHYALAQNDLLMAHQWSSRVDEDNDSHNFVRFLGLTQARLWLAQKELQKARSAFEQLYQKACQGNWGYGQIVVRIWQTLAAESPDKALGYLAEALQMAQPEGFIQSFVEAGPGLVPHLNAAAQKGIEPQYVGNILGAITTHEAHPMTSSALVEPLSERELEVLRLVTAGLSNRQIAKQLIISPGTVKTHIHNICGKLGAHNRTEAATRAQELSLV